MTESASVSAPEASDEALEDLLLDVLPPDGSTIGNLSAREALSRAAERLISEEHYEAIKTKALALGMIRKGRGRGGAIGLANGIPGGSRYEAPSAPATGNGRGRAKKEAPAKDFKAVLWASADKLRAQMDAAEYKHLVLGLIFLKYISDTFAEHRAKVSEMVSSPASDFYLGDDPADHEAALEDRDYYTQENVFWVPADARWESLRARAKQPDIGQLIDRALVAIENENPTLRGKLDKRFGAAQLEPGRLGELVDLISTIGFADEQRSGDVLGEVYEYFLGQFASAEGKKGGQFYTPAHVVDTLVAILAPNSGRVYDPCCGSGGMFVQSEKFIELHGGRRDDISIYGQESNHTTWRLAAMNLAIHGFAGDLGQEPADTFARDQFPDLKFEYILANPPFNISDWGGEKYEEDKRWVHGRPPIGNPNYAWLQHILWKLKPNGQAAVILANGSLNSIEGGENKIRESMVRADVVEVVLALPRQLFLNTQIPVCVWFLTKDKTINGRDRRGETLFIDAKGMGQMISNIQKTLTSDDINRIAETVRAWKASENTYVDVEGFCKSATLSDIASHGFHLTPGRYVGKDCIEEDDLNAEEKALSTVVAYNEAKSRVANAKKNIGNELCRVGLTRVANLLRSIDPEIVLSDEFLESTTNTLFRSWFVNHDPIKLKREKLDSGLDKELDDLFPEDFCKDTKIVTPRDWRAVPLSELFTFQGGSQPPAADFREELLDGYVRLLQIRDFDNENHITYVPKTSKLRMVNEDDILVGRYGSGSGEFGRDSLGRPLRGLSGAINVAIVKIIPKKDETREFVASFINSGTFYDLILGGSARTVQAGFRKEDLDLIYFAIPGNELMNRFEQFARAIWSYRKHTKSLKKRARDLSTDIVANLSSGKLSEKHFAESLQKILVEII